MGAADGGGKSAGDTGGGSDADAPFAATHEARRAAAKVLVVLLPTQAAACVSTVAHSTIPPKMRQKLLEARALLVDERNVVESALKQLHATNQQNTDSV